MGIPESLLRLVETFTTHRDHYTSGGYNETQLRREFIDPFFRALGWDVDNEAGYAAAYKDIVHEDAIKIAGANKAPDYSFRIGGARKFFVEAKRPSVDIQNDTAPAYQLRRYAWSAKLSVSVLSNFKEFAIYDTRVKPDPKDRASVARTFYCTYEEYPDRWAELAAILSKEAILRGSFDKYAEGVKKRRGTAEVDAAFLAEIERWRDLLARNLADRNLDLTVRDLNYAVQATIDRIIFLRMCEDRGTEDYGRLAKVGNAENAYRALCELFKAADRRYNSGLFHFRHETNEIDEPDTFTPRLIVDDKPIHDILRSLYFPESPYEFSVLPADILGQVYERFLGKTIRLTAGHHARIEDKPEVRKAGGVYYTPTYIVQHIVATTLGPLLIDAEAATKPATLARAAALKILDPACGSGSFLINAYQHLLDWHLVQYTARPDNYLRSKSPTIYRSPSGEYRLTTAERKRILLNNIFGVDIDRQAVEVTKLSLLLKVLEGETEQVIQRDWVKERERILPDLGANIRCGNSLVGSDFYADQQMLLIDEETQYRVNVFDWEKAFPEIMSRGGFDCIVANPPYGATLDSAQKTYFQRRYVCQSYQLDSYLLFLERTLVTLLRPSGRVGVIIPNPWLTNLRQDSTRRFIFGAAAIDQIVHFTFPVFKTAVVDTEVVIFQSPATTDNQVEVALCSGLDPSGRLRLETVAVHSQQEWVSENGAVINIFLKPDEKKVFRKIRMTSLPLETWFHINVGVKPYQVGKGTPPQTAADVASRPFDAKEKLDNTYRELLRGSDINRYTIDPSEKRFISYGPWLAEPRPAAGFDAAEKLLVRQTGDRPIAAMDSDKRLAMNNLHVLAPRDSLAASGIRYFLGILNSRLLAWFYRCLNPETGEALAEVKRAYVAMLPIQAGASASLVDQPGYGQLVALVDHRLEQGYGSASERSPELRKHRRTVIEATDAQIDRLVYELYGLTADEVEIVERTPL